MSDILQKICDDTRKHVEKAKRLKSVALMHRDALRAAPPRGFLRALRAKYDSADAAFIAEIKKASPSAGLIRTGFFARRNRARLRRCRRGVPVGADRRALFSGPQ